MKAGKENGVYWEEGERGVCIYKYVEFTYKI